MRTRAPLTADIRCRVPIAWMEKIEQLADKAHLTNSDIVRQAIKIYLERITVHEPGSVMPKVSRRRGGSSPAMPSLIPSLGLISLYLTSLC